MITKERLEELIEQGAIIYNKYGYKIDLAEKDNFIENIFNIYFKVEQNKLYRMNKDLKIIEEEWYLQNLFETEEDARWELEMTATRTETLKLPNFVEVENDDWLDIDFTNKYKEMCEIIIKNGIILIHNKIRVKTYFRKELTKENYIEACKLCLKLFKGEEV